MINAKSGSRDVRVERVDGVSAVESETDDDGPALTDVSLQRLKHVTLGPFRDERHHVSGDHGRVKQFGVTFGRQIQSGQVTNEPYRAWVVLNGGGNEFRIDIDSDYLVAAPMELCSNPPRTTSGIKNSRRGGNDRVHKPRLSGQVDAVARHLSKSFDVPLRMAIVCVTEPTRDSVHASILPLHRTCQNARTLNLVSESKSGLLLGASAYLIWGFFPLYFPLLDPAGSIEVLAHRVAWTLGVVVLLIVVTKRWPTLRAILHDRRKRNYLAIASIVIAINWGGFIYGVTHGHVIETSLGYFINPLVTVLLGVFVLGEKLRGIQWAALAIGFAAVIILTIEIGRLPYVALMLAFSFGTYGLMKKKANTGAIEGLTVETFALMPLAIGFLLWLELTSRASFGHEGTVNSLLLIGTGVLTAIPLLCFGGAATRLSLTSIGLLQYLTPTVQFLLGVFIFGENMSDARWAGFVLVWFALSLFTYDAIVNRRRALRRGAEQIAT